MLLELSLGIAAAVFAGPGTGGADYTMCLKVYAVKYGGKNTESVETILKIARGECSVFLRQIERDAESNELIKRETGLSLGVEKDRVIERAEAVAIKALLEARSNGSGK